MNTDNSVSDWIDAVKQGDDSAANAIWQRYFHRLVGLARTKLVGRQDRAVDEEDVALSVLDSFFAAAQKNRFPDLDDRDDLWRLLAQMTCRKAIDCLRHGRRVRRGGGNVQGESALDGCDPKLNDITTIQDSELTPELTAIVAEECQRLMNQLDANLQRVAQCKLEGYTNREIAQQHGCAVATVERRLKLIRLKWQRENETNDEGQDK